MKKLLLTLMQVLISTSAMAKWVKVGSSADVDVGITLYADPATILKSGNMVKMLRLTDFKAVQGNIGEHYMSTKRQDEYDCVRERRRIIFVAAHSKKMGEGYVVIRVINKLDDWKPISPGSQGEAMCEFACGN